MADECDLAAKENPSPKNGSDYFFRELHKSRFSRTIRLPEYVTGDPESEYKDGILKLTWNTKLPPEKRSRQIELNTKNPKKIPADASSISVNEAPKYSKSD